MKPEMATATYFLSKAQMSWIHSQARAAERPVGQWLGNWLCRQLLEPVQLLPEDREDLRQQCFRMPREQRDYVSACGGSDVVRQLIERAREEATEQERATDLIYRLPELPAYPGH